VTCAVEWATEFALDACESAEDAYDASHGARVRLVRAGRALLADWIPTSLDRREFPAGTDDDWQGAAREAYAIARQRWLAGGAP
jgi:hypothetical protein